MELNSVFIAWPHVPGGGREAGDRRFVSGGARRVKLCPNGVLQFNAHAYQAFGEPKSVEMLFDGNRKKIGLRPCDPLKVCV